MDMRMSRTEASPGAGVGSPRTGERIGARGERGQALLEFAYLLPILLILLLGMIAFGTTMNNYLEMTNGVTAGAQAVAVARGQTVDPCQTAATPFVGATPNLTQSSVRYTITIGPAGSSTPTYTLLSNSASTSCAAANTTSAPASDLTQGATVTVKVTYPCNLKVFGVNFAPSGCTLTAQTAESVQ